MSTNALAQVMSESPDAGNTLATALPVTTGTTQVNGTVGPDAFDSLTGRVAMCLPPFLVPVCVYYEAPSHSVR